MINSKIIGLRWNNLSGTEIFDDIVATATNENKKVQDQSSEKTAAIVTS